MGRKEELEELLIFHKAMYYQGRAEIDDHQYDKLENELKKLDPKNYLLEMVGASLSDEVKIRHKTKMLSLSKTYKDKELIAWMNKRDCVSMFKIDGVSCSIIYKNGKLKFSKTRGDGTWGEDISLKVKWVKTIPKTIKFNDDIEIRGEIYITDEGFLKLAEEMNIIGLDRPKSQRNIVAGLISRKDKLELSRYLKFKAFDMIRENKKIKTEVEKFKMLNDIGFSTPEITKHIDDSKIDSVIKNAKEFMSKGNFKIDGLVFSLNFLVHHEKLGETAHHPRYKMAFKFKGTSVNTKIKEIIWSISRNGILTPVAKVKTVEMSGANISNVSLHNYGLVKNYNLKKGDEIEIIRSGEVIPKFLSVIKGSKEKFTIPKECPVCGEKVFIREIRLFCENKMCPGMVNAVILNFIQKIGIDDISLKRLDEMVKKGLIREIPDLYDITVQQFLSLEKVKEKLAQKFHKSIHKSKNADIITFLSALGISGGAYNKCEKLVRSGVDSMEKIWQLTEEKLSEIDSFAEKSSKEFLKSLEDKHELIDALIAKGFSFQSKQIDNLAFSDKKICITGSLSEKRSVIEAKIRDAGGAIVSSVSTKTDYLLTNNATGSSSKLKKAKLLKIKILDESMLRDIILKF